MAKNIDLGGHLKFKSISAGKTHFKPILDGVRLGEHLIGKEFRDIKTLHDAYCSKTNWVLKSPAVAFFAVSESQNGLTTRYVGVMFEDGSTDRYSLDRLLNAAAK